MDFFDEQFCAAVWTAAPVGPTVDSRSAAEAREYPPSAERCDPCWGRVSRYNVNMNDDQIKQKLHDLEDELPVPVSDWVVEQRVDSSGEDSVWVWAILEDRDFNRANTEAIGDKVRNALLDRSRNARGWVYVRFRTTSEVLPA